MTIDLFTSLKDVLGGLFIGVIFGVLLQKGGVTRYSTIVNQFLFKDFTVMKIIMTAIATGSLGIYGAQIFHGKTELLISSTTLFAALLGGGIFGIGMALLGYCPGTCVGAIASGNKDIWFGLFGMIVGAALYAELSPWITREIKPPEAINQLTLPDYFGVSPWIFIIPLVGSILLSIWFSKRTIEKSETKKNQCAR